MEIKLFPTKMAGPLLKNQLPVSKYRDVLSAGNAGAISCRSTGIHDMHGPGEYIIISIRH
jgi:hypothetical protein